MDTFNSQYANMTSRVESLTSLLRTIGASLDSSDRGPAMVCNPSTHSRGLLLLIISQMDAYFARIQMIIDIPGLNSRLRFMLMVCIQIVFFITSNFTLIPATGYRRSPQAPLAIQGL